jgi:hypothetical protein
LKSLCKRYKRIKKTEKKKKKEEKKEKRRNWTEIAQSSPTTAAQLENPNRYLYFFPPITYRLAPPVIFFPNRPSLLHWKRNCSPAPLPLPLARSETALAASSNPRISSLLPL